MAFGKEIQKLIVTLAADNAAFKRELDKSARDAQSWGDKVNATLRKSAKIGAGIATAAVAAAVVTVSETRKSIDAQAKFADSIGLSTEALAAHEHAAEINGASIEGLRKGYERLVVNVGDFKKGIGESKEAFERLNISVDDLQGKSPDKRFELVGDRLKTIPDQAERAALAYEIFGRQGIKLVKTLELGSGGMAELREESDRLGLSLSRVDAAQVEAANDAITRAQAVNKGFANRLTVELAPAIEAVADMYRQAALESAGFGDTAALTGDVATAAIGAIGDTWQEVSLGIVKSREQLANFLADYFELLESTKGIRNIFALGNIDAVDKAIFGDTGEKARIFREMGETYGAEYVAGINSIVEQGSFSDRFEKQLAERRKRVAEAVGQMGAHSVGVGVNVGVDSDALKAQDQALAKVKSLLEAAEPAWKKYADSVAVAKSLLQAGELSQSEYNNALTLYKQRLDDATGANAQIKQDFQDAARFADSAKTELEKLNDELARAQQLAEDGLISGEVLSRTEARITEAKENLKDANSELTVFAEQAARNIQDALGDTILASMNGTTDGLLDMWSNMLKQMVAEAIAAQIGEALGLENLLSGGKSGESGLIQKGLDLLSFDGGGFTGDGTRSGGLDGRGGFLAMVHPNETVVDHTKGQQLGPANNITINYRGSGDRREDKSAAGAMARDINRMVQAGRRYS